MRRRRQHSGFNLNTSFKNEVLRRVTVLAAMNQGLRDTSVANTASGYKIWHMGDTGLFGNMKFISDRYKPDLVLIPIGSNFTMDPEDAADAMKCAITEILPMTGGRRSSFKLEIKVVLQGFVKR